METEREEREKEQIEGGEVELVKTLTWFCLCGRVFCFSISHPLIHISPSDITGSLISSPSHYIPVTTIRQTRKKKKKKNKRKTSKRSGSRRRRIHWLVVTWNPHHRLLFSLIWQPWHVLFLLLLLIYFQRKVLALAPLDLCPILNYKSAGNELKCYYCFDLTFGTLVVKLPEEEEE